MQLIRIFKPKTEISVSPPIQASGELQQLPLYQLGAKNFERLCARLASVQTGVLEALLYGVNGQDQHGIDVYARLKDSSNHTVYQAKCYSNPDEVNLAEIVYTLLYENPKTAQGKSRNPNVTELKKTGEPEKKWAKQGNTFVLCVACKCEKTHFETDKQVQRERLEQLGIGFEVWDEVRITNELRKHPEIVYDFFGLEWVRKLFSDESTYIRFKDNLDDLVKIPVPRSHTTPSGALRSENRSVPFRFRRQERKKYIEWLNKSDDFAVKVFTGKGGIGKTRLFLEIARIMRCLGWTAGFIDKKISTDQLHTILNRETPLFLIFDYAEGRKNQLEALISRLDGTTRKYPVRVALLARDTGEWLETLIVNIPNAREIIQKDPIAIKPIPNDSQTRERSYREAFLAYLKQFDTPNYEQRKNWIPTPPDLSHETFQRVLAIHISALNMVLAETTNPPEDLSTILDILLEHEMRAWDSISTEISQNESRSRERLRRVMTIATLYDGFSSETQALEMVQKAPLFELSNADQHRTVLRRLKALYPKDKLYIAPLEPDILGERLVQKELESPEGQQIINLVFGEPEPSESPPIANLETAIAVLIRMVQWNPDSSEQLLRTVLENRMQLLALIVFDSLPEATVKLRKLAVDCGEYAERIIDNPISHLSLLHDLGIRYRQSGLHSKALEINLKTRTIYEKLATAQPEVFKPDFAMSLLSLGNCYGTLGMRELALQVTLDAVKIYKELSFENPDIFELNLARSLSSLGNRFSQLGMKLDALKVSQDAIDIFRKYPETAKSDFAGTLSNLGSKFTDLGKYEDARIASEEATKKYEELAQHKPDTFNMLLAMSFTNLGMKYSDLGEHNKAEETILKAKVIYNQLINENPDVFLPDHAMNLHNLTICYGNLEKFDLALQEVQNALSILKLYFSKYGSQFTERYVSCLMLAIDLYKIVNQKPNAIKSIYLAIQVFAELFFQHPKVFLDRMLKLIYDYNIISIELNLEPDHELLNPILEKLEQLQSENL